MPIKTSSPFTQSNLSSLSDPLSKNYQAKTIASQGLKTAAIGAQVGGPIGAAAGLVLGGIYGAITSDQQIAQAKKQKEIGLGFDAKSEVMNNELNMQKKEYNTMEQNKDLMNNQDPSSMTMEKPLKQLSPYTASYSAYNMSAKQASVEPLMQKLSGASTLSPITKFKDQTGDGKITQADVIKARTEGYEENPNKD